jgi:hypothetical protein
MCSARECAGCCACSDYCGDTSERHNNAVCHRRRPHPTWHPHSAWAQILAHVASAQRAQPIRPPVGGRPFGRAERSTLHTRPWPDQLTESGARHTPRQPGGALATWLLMRILLEVGDDRHRRGSAIKNGQSQSAGMAAGSSLVTASRRVHPRMIANLGVDHG